MKTSSEGATNRTAPRAQESFPSHDLGEPFAREFGRVAFVLNRHLIDHWLRAARHFEMDFESLVIWGVLAHQNVAHLMLPGAPPADPQEASGAAIEPQPRFRALRLRDLSQITGIPRETVRRKLALLRERGWVEYGSEGWVIVNPQGNADLIEFTRESTRRFLDAAREVSRLLREAAAPG